MATNSNIEWTDHTFNPWRGCTKVSPGCKFCYAETLSKRNPAALGNWGPQGLRVVASESYWRQPIKWNANARTAGVRARVFCASLADVFEAADTMPTESVQVVAAARYRLLRLIYDTPWLDWLLLTKRPENIVPALKEARMWASGSSDFLLFEWLCKWTEDGTPPANVWLGTSVENQEQTAARIPHLLAAPAAVRFLSCEPLLGPVDLTQIYCEPVGNHRTHNVLTGIPYDWDYEQWEEADHEEKINWVIVGGESGHGARAMHPDWARGLRDQCQAAGVAFFFKQWGEWGPTEAIYAMYPGKPIIPARFGYKCHDFTPDLIKRFPGDTDNEHIIAWKLGKHTAGRLLDGRTWDELPAGKEVASV